MSNTPNQYLFLNSKLVTESREPAFQLGLSSPEFLPNPITKPYVEPVKALNAVTDGTNYVPGRNAFTVGTQIVLPTLEDFLLTDKFLLVSDLPPEQIGQVLSPTRSNSVPSQVHLENSLSTTPSQFVGKQHIPYTLDITSPEEKQSIEYTLLRNASRMALRGIPDDISMGHYWDILEDSLSLIKTVVRDTAPMGLSKRSDVPAGPCLDDFLRQYVVEFEDVDSPTSYHEPRLSVLKRKSVLVELESPERSLSELVRELSSDVEEYMVKVRPIKKNTGQNYPSFKDYFNNVRKWILNGNNPELAVQKVMDNKPSSLRYFSEQYEALGIYIRNLLRSNMQKTLKRYRNGKGGYMQLMYLTEVTHQLEQHFSHQLRHFSIILPSGSSNGESPIKDVRRRDRYVNRQSLQKTYNPENRATNKPIVVAESMPAENRPLVMRDSLFFDVYLSKR